MERLTTRETEIANLIHLGNTNDEIGSKLHISSETVKTHRKNIMQKMEARNTADVVRIFMSKIKGAAVYVIIAAVVIIVTLYVNSTYPELIETLNTSLINLFEN